MRHLAVGDVHGCLRALTALAAFAELTPDDVLITLGDYVDRGPDSCAVLDWLIARQRRGTLVALRGNHEIMMMEARDNDEALHVWKSCGGDAALASYSPFGDKGRLADVPDSHWDFLEATLPFYEIPTHFFVHANAYPDLELDEQPDYLLYWEPFENAARHGSGKVMVCGHTPQRSGRPCDVGFAVCIDTWAWGKGWLTALDVATGRYWQANQRGECRGGWLEGADD